MTNEAEVKDSYSSYVHTGNSGFSVEVHVEYGEGYASQYLTTSIHAFGMPHETKMWLDDNILDALEYIVTKAREQRKAIPELNAPSWSFSSKAVPPYTREEAYGGRCSSDESSADEEEPQAVS